MGAESVLLTTGQYRTATNGAVEKLRTKLNAIRGCRQSKMTGPALSKTNWLLCKERTAISVLVGFLTQYFRLKQKKDI